MPDDKEHVGYTDLAGSQLTADMILDAAEDLKRASKRYRKEGYRFTMEAGLLRANGFDLPADIPDNAMVSLAENGPMRVTRIGD